MREIKFRFYSKELQKYVPFNELDMQETNDIVSGKSHELNDIIVEQYTGLKDKNGTEIYEGDILEEFDTSDLYMVEFGRGCFLGKTLEDNYEDLYCVYHNCTVIGNIHENPELLKATK